MSQPSLLPYVPRLLTDWDGQSSWRQVDGTLVFVDISGFTNLSERLARRGRIGAEELTEVLNRVFGNMLDLAYKRRGSLLKFGGDALLLLFEGPDHPQQAVAAAVEMRSALGEASRIPTSVGRIPLRMSVGVHSGLVDVFTVGTSHHELLISGPAATETTAMEHAASAGEILISPATRSRLPAGAADRPKAGGYLLSYRKAHTDPSGVSIRPPVDADRLESSVPMLLGRYLGSGQVDSEHRLATVAFVKYVGIDDVIANEGPARAADHLHSLVSLVQRAADAEEVTFLATDVDENGGKVILCVGAPVSREDDEGRILRAARAIASGGAPLDVKIGINRGHVFAADIGTEVRRTFTVMGDTVNLAARLMAAAPAGSIYASPEVLDRSRTLFETRALEPFKVKGKTEPVQAYDVGEITGTREMSARRVSVLVGRDEELGAVRRALAALPDGSAITVVGDTGIGKTRLVDEALEGVEAEVLKLQGEPYGADNPYWVFRDPLRALLGIERSEQRLMRAALAGAVERLDPSLLPLLPLIGDVVAIDVPETEASRSIEAQFRPERTASLVVNLLEAAFDGPLAIWVDDTHWIDDASHSVLARLAATAAEHGWVLLTAARGEETPRYGDVITLAPLRDEHAMAMAVEATRAAPLLTHELEAIVARAAGNPLFVEEIVRLVRQSGRLDELPDSLDAVMAAEIDTLRPHTRRLLRYSSVLGRSFRRLVLEEMLRDENVGLDPATTRELARFIVAEGKDRLRFRHAVMQAAAYQGLSYRRRRQLHERAGEVIERLAGADPEAVSEFLAIHFSLSGNSEKAWRYSVIAGRRAQAAYANVEAEGHYRRALEAWPRLSTAPDRVELLMALGEVREHAGLFPQALAAYRDGLASASSDALTRADLQIRCARVNMRMGRFRASLGAVTRAHRLIDTSPDARAQRLRARATSSAAAVRMSQERPAEAEKLARSAVTLAQRAGEQEALAAAYLVLDWSLWMQGRASEAVHGTDAMRIYESLDQPVNAATVMNNLGAYAYFDGRWDEAVAWYRRSIDWFRRGGSETGGAMGAANTAEVLINQGRLEDAAEMVEMAVRSMVSAGNEEELTFALIQRARLWAQRGEVEAAEAGLREALERARAMGRTSSVIEISVHLGRVLTGAGRFDEARLLLDEVTALGAPGVHGPVLALALAELALADHDWEAAASHIEAGIALADEWGMVYEQLSLRRLRVDLGRSRGIPVDADEIAAVGREAEALGILTE